MVLMPRLSGLRFLATLATLTLPLLANPARAQTWVGNRQGPRLAEILAIDGTGETPWPWGAEDVAGDTLAQFSPREQAIDARTVYVATDAARFYSRVYFSVPQAEPGEVTTFVLIDSDQNPTTGGRASAAELDPTLTADPSNGGYEYVIKVQRAANGTATGTLWHYDATNFVFAQVTTVPSQLVAESNVFLDPLRINEPNHGYVQSSAELGVVGLTQACTANIFVRTTNQTGGLGAGDLDVGSEERCVPTVNPDTNVPVVVTPPAGCTSNAECPNGGICTGGNCVLTHLCATNADCPATEVCNTEGLCVASVPSDAGQVYLAPGEKIQGGACACRSGPRGGAGTLEFIGLLGLTLLYRNTKRERQQ
jgi:hypothetical protein